MGGVARAQGKQQRALELRLSASEFQDRIALLIPPLRTHRDHYFGVLAPNSPWRELVTAQAGRKLAAGSKPTRPKAVDADSCATRGGHPARYLWARLLARIYGVFALKCSGCGGWVRLIGFITEPATVRQILAHVDEPTTAPAIAPARSPPVEANAQQLIAPEAVEAIPELEFDQTANPTAGARDYQWMSPVDADAEPIPELEFDHTVGWKFCAAVMAHAAEHRQTWSSRLQSALSIQDCQSWSVEVVLSPLVALSGPLKIPYKSDH